MIIFDLDGTLANCEHRRHFVVPTCKQCKSILDDSIQFDLGWHCHYPCDNVTHKDDWQPDWQAFYEACDKDEPIDPTIEIFKSFYTIKNGDPNEIQIWSGRCESTRKKTLMWLDYHINPTLNFFNKVKMRSIGDNTPDDQLKERWLDEAIEEGKHIEMVFDDRPKVIRMWRRRGIFVFNCCQHDEEF